MRFKATPLAKYQLPPMAIEWTMVVLMALMMQRCIDEVVMCIAPSSRAARACVYAGVATLIMTFVLAMPGTRRRVRGHTTRVEDSDTTATGRMADCAYTVIPDDRTTYTRNETARDF